MHFSKIPAAQYPTIPIATAQCQAVKEFSKSVTLAQRILRVFHSIYLSHLLHGFHAQGVTQKGKLLAPNCLFQNYSQSLDNLT